MRGLGPFLKDAWRLARPYLRSEERWSAWGLLVAIIALNLALVGMSVHAELLEPRVLQRAAGQGLARVHRTCCSVYRHTPSGLMPGFC